MAIGYSTFVSYFQTYGIMDFLLPFILIFTITFAILQKANIFGPNTKNFNVVIALVLSLLFVAPHMTGSYPTGYDPVQVLNEALPSISLVAVAVIMVLMLLGIFGSEYIGFSRSIMGFIAIVAVAFIVYIFGSTSALNFWRAPDDIFYWWTPELTELLLIILVFALIIKFITKTPAGQKGNEQAKAAGGRVKNFLEGIFPAAAQGGKKEGQI